jgi:Rps23 Pro-64 3,4-dihydroxylase Tpa1-like proline 4-hydroxylase
MNENLKDFAKTIVNSLEKNKDTLKKQFMESSLEVGVRYCYLDQLLPEKTAYEIFESFPKKEEMRKMSSFREEKYTSKNFDQFKPILADITFAIQDPKVISIVEEITGIKNQIPDSTLYAGGLSLMEKDNFLNPHIDNSHEQTRMYYRTLNLLYYVTPDWKLEYGGNLELWDKKVKKNVTIVSKFNRLVIMETNPWSWHSVSPVVVEKQRVCVSNYYFSADSPIGDPYFNVTSFNGRPNQKIRRMYSYFDGKLRNFIRYLFPKGIGKVDVYHGKKQ